MRRLSVLFVVLGLAAGCSSSSPSSPSSPTNPTYTADLKPANEVPAATGPETSGSGSVTITFIVTKDSSNNITSASASFVGTFSGFPAGTTLTAAHIHPGAAGTSGSPNINLD